MQEVLFEYEMHPTTWVYLSSLMVLGIYFKFHRLWSIRNLDLIGLIVFAPGLLLVARGQEQVGYGWLFAIGGLYLIRLLADPILARRPLLEPNLSASGLTFTAVALVVFLMTNVVTARLGAEKSDGARRWEDLIEDRAAPAKSDGSGSLEIAPHGPGYRRFHEFARMQRLEASPTVEQSRRFYVQVAIHRATTILGHLAVALGMVFIGYRHFGSLQTGIAAGVLYLLLPYTGQMTGRIDHVIPAALLVWAVAAYRRPTTSGALLGVAAGLIFYPVFLLPLWCGFYWQRGLFRFLGGFLAVLACLVVMILLTAENLTAVDEHLWQLLGYSGFSIQGADGFWTLRGESWHFYRYPIIASFVALCGSLAFWPAQKNLGTLLGCSAAVMLATQYWHPHQGGLYMAWYLPLLLLTILRPNLEDRIATTAISEHFLPLLLIRRLRRRFARP